MGRVNHLLRIKIMACFRSIIGSFIMLQSNFYHRLLSIRSRLRGEPQSLLVLPTAMRIPYAAMGLPPRPAVLSVSIPETFDDLRMSPKQFVCGHSNRFHVLSPTTLPLPPRNISTKRSRSQLRCNFHVLAPLILCRIYFSD